MKIHNHIWLYSPVKWTLASLTTAFHSFLFLALVFEFLIPRLLRPLSRSSNYRFLGRPLLLPLSILVFSIILGFLSSLILSMCPNHLILSALINPTIFSWPSNSSISLLDLLFLSPSINTGPEVRHLSYSWGGGNPGKILNQENWPTRHRTRPALSERQQQWSKLQ